VLIITRKVGERIMIGEEVVLHVIEASGGSTRLGIEAPRSLPIYREEIWNALRAGSRRAAPVTAEMPSRPVA
jgi:carbon storage regulator